MNDCEIENLKSEYDHEKTCRETVAWQNGELEKQIMQMQEELRKGDYPWDNDEDLVKENSRHKLLLDAIETLREQLPILKDKIKSAKVCGADCKLKHDDLNISLDILTPMAREYEIFEFIEDVNSASNSASKLRRRRLLEKCDPFNLDDTTLSIFVDIG